VNGTTVLDVLADIARTEVGELFAMTTGTLTAAVEYIEVRAHDRPATPEATFDVSADLQGPPSFIRDITNVAAQVQVSGPTQAVTVNDPTVTGRYITSGAAETVLYTGDEDLREWGQDRLNRGKNRAVRAQTFTVDAVSTPIDRSVDLLALLPGDRVQLTNTPTARLGFNTWDGFILGGSESHTPTSNSFTFNVAPVQPPTAVYDTDRFADTGNILLGNTYNSTATSLVFNGVGTGSTLSTDVPYTILIDTEQMTVTAVAGSTATVTRGANGTTPASHTVNATISVVPTALYAY